ncbi:hypothetical protein Dimus_011093, partial [Dionaea muscipula]
PSSITVEGFTCSPRTSCRRRPIINTRLLPSTITHGSHLRFFFITIPFTRYPSLTLPRACIPNPPSLDNHQPRPPITSAACADHDRGREEQQHATALLNRSLPPFSCRRRRYFIKGVRYKPSFGSSILG